MRKIVLLTGLLFSNFLPGRTQDSAERRMWRDSALHAVADTSRINYLRRLCNAYLTDRPDSAIFYARLAVGYSRKIGWVKGEAQNLLNMGAAFTYAFKYDSAILTDDLALAAAKKTGDQNRIALVYINRGTAYTETYDFEKALADLNQAMKICEATGNRERKARAAQSLSEFYVFQDNFTAAMPWAKMAFQLQSEVGEPDQVMIARLDLGSLYTHNKIWREAGKMLLETVRESRKLNRPDIFVECAMSLSDLYSQQKQFGKAIGYLVPALAEARRLGISEREANLCNNLGNTYLAIQEPSKALEAFKRGAGCVETSPAFRKAFYECLFGEARSLAALGRHEEAYQRSEMATRLQDSFLLKTQNERMARLQTQFETERRESEIALLQKDRELARLALDRQKSLRLGIIVISLLLLGMAALLVARYRVLQRNRQLQQMEKLRQSISRDLHDDMGSALSSIHINSKVALDQSENLVLVRDRLDKIRQNAGRMMQGMSDIVWAINPANDSLEQLVIRAREFSHEVFDPLDITLHFSDNLSAAGAAAGLGKRKEIFMILKESVNNAAKYSQAKNVTIGIETTRRSVLLKIKDDGLGFDPAVQRRGNGLRNMAARAAAMNGKFEMRSAPGAGTTLSVEIPIP